MIHFGLDVILPVPHDSRQDFGWYEAKISEERKRACDGVRKGETRVIWLRAVVGHVLGHANDCATAVKLRPTFALLDPVRQLRLGSQSARAYRQVVDKTPLPKRHALGLFPPIACLQKKSRQQAFLDPAGSLSRFHI